MNEPAFPVCASDIDGSVFIRQTGMNLRDYFAAKAMQAILTDPKVEKYTLFEIANDAYRMADAMLAEREKNKIK